MHLRSLAVLLSLAVAAPAARAATPVAGFAESDVVSGLTAPTALAFLPDGRSLVTQLGGELLLVDHGAASLVTTIPACAARDQGLEIGLLGIAVHPDYPANRRIYLYRTSRTAGACGVAAPDRVNELICIELDPNGTMVPNSLIVLLTGIRTDTGVHDGGGLRVGPDRNLYLGVGDTGLGDQTGPPGTSTNPYAQDAGALEGKILRLDLDGKVPADNPFVAQTGKRAQVFAYGFRNPFRLGFDPVNGKLWVGDVGQNTIEEIDVVVPGGNYGWPRCEGTRPAGCEQPGDVAPAFTYPHDGPGALGDSVIGGAFAEAGAFAALAGAYFFADFGDDHTPGTLYYAALDGARSAFSGPPAPVLTNVEGPVDLVFGPDGALYYVAYLAGAVRRVTTTLGAAGCTSVGECAFRLAAALPAPNLAGSPAARKVAKRLARLQRKAAAALARAAHAKKPRRPNAKARNVLGQLLAAARKANEGGSLGVPLGPLESAVAALLAIIPA
jgi:glucose/arabinose dehydrogenase